MLTEQRYEVILKLLEEKNSITVSEVKDLLNTSDPRYAGTSQHCIMPGSW